MSMRGGFVPVSALTFGALSHCENVKRLPGEVLISPGQILPGWLSELREFAWSQVPV
jgi:hypothetical protein